MKNVRMFLRIFHEKCAHFTAHFHENAQIYIGYAQNTIVFVYKYVNLSRNMRNTCAFFMKNVRIYLRIFHEKCAHLAAHFSWKMCAYFCAFFMKNVRIFLRIFMKNVRIFHEKCAHFSAHFREKCAHFSQKMRRCPCAFFKKNARIFSKNAQTSLRIFMQICTHIYGRLVRGLHAF